MSLAPGTPSDFDGRAGVARSLAMGVVAASLIFRLWIPRPTYFWEDEIIAATHAVQPLGQVFLNALRYDVHPPLYFVQLHFWSLLYPQTVGSLDFWLILNSAVWSIAAVLSIWWVTSRIFGRDFALIATVLFAVNPISLFMAHELRMYAMLSTLVIWAHYLAYRNFTEKSANTNRLIVHALVLVAIVNTHAIGFVAVFLNGAYSLSLLTSDGGQSRRRVAELSIYAVAAVAAVPWLLSGISHDANLPAGETLGTFVTSLAQMTIGPIAIRYDTVRLAGALIYCAIVLAGLMTPKARMMSLIFLIAPIVLCIATGIALKPIFKWNFFATISSPFVAIVLAEAIGQIEVRFWRLVATLFGVLAFSTIAIATRAAVRKSDDFQNYARVIRANLRQGDLVYAPQVDVFWGMAWYLVGPHWGSPLAIAPPPPAKWQALFAKLGPERVRYLGLFPASQMLSADNIKLLVGIDSIPKARFASRVWMVTLPSANLPVEFPPEKLNSLPRQWTSTDSHTRLTLYAEQPERRPESEVAPR